MADFESNDWWKGEKNLDTIYADAMSVADRLKDEHEGNRDAAFFVLTDALEDHEFMDSLPDVDPRELVSLQDELPSHIKQLAAGTRMLLQRAAVSETEYTRAVNAIMWLSFVKRYSLLAELRMDPPENYILDREYLVPTQREQGDFASSQLLHLASINMMEFTNLGRSLLLQQSMRQKGQSTDFNKGLREPFVRELRSLAAMLPQVMRPDTIELPYTGYRDPILDDDDIEEIYEGVVDKEATLSDICITIEDTVGAIDLVFDEKGEIVDDDENIPDTDFAQMQQKLLQCQCQLLGEHYGMPEVTEIEEGHELHGIPPHYRPDYVHLKKQEGRRFTKDVMHKYIRIVDEYKRGLDDAVLPEEQVSAIAAAKMSELMNKGLRKQRSHKKRDPAKEKRKKQQVKKQKQQQRKRRK
jgi:hypothetical protein